MGGWPVSFLLLFKEFEPVPPGVESLQLNDILHWLPKCIVGLFGDPALAGAALIVPVHVDGHSQSAHRGQVGE